MRARVCVHIYIKDYLLYNHCNFRFYVAKDIAIIIRQVYCYIYIYIYIYIMIISKYILVYIYILYIERERER